MQRGSDKGIPFEDSFELLGFRLDAAGLGKGAVRLCNKPLRVERLTDKLRTARETGELSLREGQNILGQLNFMVGFVMGRSLKMVCRAFANFVAWQGRCAHEVIQHLASWSMDVLSSSKPRELLAGEDTAPVLVYTDAAFEAGVATWGLVVCPPGERAVVAGGTVPQEL